MLAILSTVDLPALLLAPFAAVLPTFLFSALGEANLHVSPSGLHGSHGLNLTLGGLANGQNNTQMPQMNPITAGVTSNDPLADEMAAALFPHLHTVLEFILG